MMRTFSLLLFFAVFAGRVTGQIRQSILTLEFKEKYEILGTDIVVVDTLVMKDSSTIVLNPNKKENYIHAHKIVIGRGCQIIGKGVDGKAGKNGPDQITSAGPCRSGSAGKKGTSGIAGIDGVTLMIYTNELLVHGSLLIDLSGGDGGDGGKGGKGGDGHQGTKVCKGGDGGSGADGEWGANGGNGGNLSLYTKYGTDLRGRIAEKVRLRSVGGFAGLGGEGGLGGQRGLSPLRNGNQGVKGKPGRDGKSGKQGGLFFELKIK